MNFLLTLAWRNVWRNKRRSIITILAVTFAVMLSIAMRGIQLGTYEVNIRHVVELFTGYVQIQNPGYQNNPSLRKSIRMTPELRSLLADDPRILGYAPRIVGDGLISFRENSQGAVIFGVDPAAERSVSTLGDKIDRGTFLADENSHDIVVGHTLLENLGASLGDELVVLAQGFDGSLGNLKFRIAGTVKTGMLDLDRSAAFMNLVTAQELLLMERRASLIAVRLADLQQIDPVQESLSSRLAPIGLVALSWSDVMPDLKQGIELDNVSGLLTLAILIIVVAFGITNTVLMSVTERFREFGIVLSVGMQPRTLTGLVLLETACIVALGMLAGNVLAYGINSYIAANPILLGSDFEQMYAEYGFLPRIESTVRFSSFVNNTLSILGVSLIAALYPLTKVMRLEPLKGIRYT
jgi:putative ABC transport system permease protein